MSEIIDCVVYRALFIFFSAVDISRDGTMNHWEMENTVALGVALKEAGFEISQICCSRPSCFDFAASNNGNTVLVKVNSDVDTFPAKSAQELKMIASRVSAASLIISQRAHGKLLEEDTVYSRNAVSVITEKTIKNIALSKANPLVYAGPGGYSVEVDGKLVEQKRKDLSLSIGKLAAMIGVSRRTLYGYERGMAKASVKTAYKLAETLGVPVAKPINVLERTRKQRQCFLAKAKQIIAGRALLQRVLRKFAFSDVFPVYKAPFDFIMNSPNCKGAIIGSVASEDETNLENRIQETVSICNVIHGHPVLIMENPQIASKHVSCIPIDELSSICKPEELLVSI